MARGLNKVMLVGNLGADPEMRYTAKGSAVANVNLATAEAWRDRDSGEQQERTEWHRLVFFGRLAEIAGEYLRKGSQVYVEGRLQTRKWQDRDGNDRYTTEIVVNDMQMLGSRGGSGGAAAGPQPGRRSPRRARRRRTTGTAARNGAVLRRRADERLRRRHSLLSRYRGRATPPRVAPHTCSKVNRGTFSAGSAWKPRTVTTHQRTTRPGRTASCRVM